jgi:hypothetical protein
MSRHQASALANVLESALTHLEYTFMHYIMLCYTHVYRMHSCVDNTFSF